MPVHIKSTDTPLLTTDEAAKVMKMSAAFLARDRWLAKKHGTKPKVPFVKFGRSIRYRRNDLVNANTE